MVYIIKCKIYKVIQYKIYKLSIVYIIKCKNVEGLHFALSLKQISAAPCSNIQRRIWLYRKKPKQLVGLQYVIMLVYIH